MNQQSLKSTLYAIIFLAIACSTIISASVITLNFYLDYKNSLIKGVNDFAYKIKDNIEKVLSLGLDIQDVPGFDREINEKMKDEKNVLYVFITDKNNEIILSSDEHLKSGKFNYKNNDTVIFNGENAINLVSQLKSQDKKEIAYLIHIGLKKSLLTSKLYSTFLLVVAISVISILVVFSIFKRIIKNRLFDPLVELKEATNKVARGDLKLELRPLRNDEIGVVTDNFVKMVSELHDIVLNIKESLDKLKVVGETATELITHVKSGSLKEQEGIGIIENIFFNIEERVDVLRTKLNTLNDFIELTTSTFLELSSSSEEIFKTMEELVNSVTKVDDAYNRLTNINIKLDEGADKLAKEVENILSFVSEMDSSIKMTLINIQETSAISEKMTNIAKESKTALKSSVQSIDNIAKVALDTKNAFTTLRVSISKITTILDVISEVAEQTNMLALNAAIIAAQSDEGGRAFAIVAEEIKNLSRRTQHSTKEIGELISGITEQTENVNLKVQESVTEGELAVGKIKEIEYKINEIIRLIDASSVGIKEIVKAANEQSQGSSTVRKEVEDLKSLSIQLTNMREQGNMAGKTLGDLVEFIAGVANRVGTAVKEQNESINGVKKSLFDLNSFSKDIVEHTNKEKEELSQAKPILIEIKDLAKENVEKTIDLDQKLLELKHQLNLFNELTKKFILKKQD